MYLARNARSVPIVLPASGAEWCSGTYLRMYSSTSYSASATVTPLASSSMRPLSVCIAMTNSLMLSKADLSGLMTMLKPSSTGLRS